MVLGTGPAILGRSLSRARDAIQRIALALGLARCKQRFQIFLVERQLVARAPAFQNCLREFGLARLQLLDAFLDSAGANQSVNEHRLVLTDAMCAIARLR